MEKKHLVLAGAGYANLHILKDLSQHSWPNLEVTLIAPNTEQIHSCSISNCLSGYENKDKVSLNISGIAKAAKAEFVRNKVISVNPVCREITIETGKKISYDVLSLAVGAKMDSEYLQSEGYKVINAKPFDNFVIKFNEMLNSFSRHSKARIAVLGGGAAGLELALITHFRLSRLVDTRNIKITLITGEGFIPNWANDTRLLAKQILYDRRINLAEGKAYAGKNGLILANGDLLPVDFVLVATNVKPLDWFADCNLSLCKDGFFAVKDTYQTLTNRSIFASGDCCTRIDVPQPRSAISAIYAGSYLSQNVHRRLQEKPLISNALPKWVIDFVATGYKEALMNWGAFTACGYWVWRWKSWRDKRFLQSYTKIVQKNIEKESESEAENSENSTNSTNSTNSKSDEKIEK